MGAIYLVRHGQASFGAQDYDRLSERGVEQAAVVGAELRRRGMVFAHARSGSLARQRKTAEAALAALDGRPVAKEDPRWNEYDHVDIVTHHVGAAAQDAADPRAYQAALDAALAGWVRAGRRSGAAETWPAFQARTRDALEDVAAGLGKGEHAVVFTSGGVIGAVCGGLLGTAEQGFLTLNRVTVNAGITKVVSGRGGLTLLSFNEHPHFEAEAAHLLTYR
jgi:broad specificity phosphatase PhoE